MSDPQNTGSRPWLRPSTIFITIFILLLVALLTSPGNDRDDPRASSHLTTPNGTRGTYDVLQKLGFSAQRMADAYTDTLSAKPIYVLLEPTIRLSDAEQARLFGAVRRGAGLFIAARDPELADSLGFSFEPLPDGIDPNRFYLDNEPTGWMRDTADHDETVSPWNAETMSSRIGSGSVELKDDEHESPEFLWFRGSDTTSVVMRGAPFGKGQVVFLSAPYLIRNKTARGGIPIVALVRALRWMEADHRPLLFDEFHHGYGVHADIPSAITAALTETSAGRATLQGIVALLILVLAIAVRPLAPTKIPVITRRSPIEHAVALGNAYAQLNPSADATTFSLDRLLAGLRRRRSLGVPRALPHEEYLSAVQARFPSTMTDATALQAMLDDKRPHPIAVASAHIARIEHTMTTSTRS